MIQHGAIYWVNLGPAAGSRPAKHRPVLVIQADDDNSSRIATAVVAVITSNLAVADWPGNVFLPSASSGLPRDSVVNVTHVTLDKADLRDYAGLVPGDLMRRVLDGLAMVLQPPLWGTARERLIRS